MHRPARLPGMAEPDSGHAPYHDRPPRNPQSRGNVHLLLSRLSDGEVVANDRWNLYGLTNSWISSRTLFAPHWMDLAPGDALVLQSFCQNINGIASAAKAKAHVWWWTGDTQ